MLEERQKLDKEPVDSACAHKIGSELDEVSGSGVVDALQQRCAICRREDGGNSVTGGDKPC